MSKANIFELTVFVESAAFLIAQLEEAAVDYPAFEQKYRPCELSRCRATCCHDGVYLSAEDAQRVEVLAGKVRQEKSGKYSLIWLKFCLKLVPSRKTVDVGKQKRAMPKHMNWLMITQRIFQKPSVCFWMPKTAVFCNDSPSERVGILGFTSR